MRIHGNVLLLQMLEVTTIGSHAGSQAIAEVCHRMTRAVCAWAAQAHMARVIQLQVKLGVVLLEDKACRLETLAICHQLSLGSSRR